MFKFLMKMFSENSQVSAMRVMCFVSLLLGGGIACYGISHGQDLNALAVLCGVFVGSAFGAKVGQKFAEGKQPPGEDK